MAEAGGPGASRAIVTRVSLVFFHSDEHAELKEEVAKLQKDVAEGERNAELTLRNAQVGPVAAVRFLPERRPNGDA